LSERVAAFLVDLLQQVELMHTQQKETSQRNQAAVEIDWVSLILLLELLGQTDRVLYAGSNHLVLKLSHHLALAKLDIQFSFCTLFAMSIGFAVVMVEFSK